VTAARAILITGASSGIGLAAVRTMKERGWRVIAAARKADDRERLVREVGVEAVALDLDDDASVAACAENVLTLTAGRLDALFNNAAFGQVGAVEDITAPVLRRQLQVNLVGTHDLTRRLLPAMRRQGHGRIVQCSSVLGYVAAPYRGAYCASKYALEGLSDALRLELSGSGIAVSIIAPGPIRSRFLDNALANFRTTVDPATSVHRDGYARRIAAIEAGGATTFKLEPDAVAAKLVHAVESSRPRPRYYVTTPAYLAMAARRLLPTRLIDQLTLRQ
jgi:NAD(P)-dependent dehydrogenase (short-subunit alcohol dehydrogenase family)